MSVVVLFHLFTYLQNLCSICGGTKRESNTRKIRTRTHTDSHYKLESNISYLPTPPLGQDMTQGQFSKRGLTGLNSEFSFS